MIIRSPRTSTFTVLDNETLRDRRLSWRARGILAYLLSMPDNWAVSSLHLAEMGKEGRDAVRTALTELEECGYLERDARRDALGRWEAVSIIYDRPKYPQVCPQPEPDNPTPDNQAQRSTYKELLSEQVVESL